MFRQADRACGDDLRDDAEALRSVARYMRARASALYDGSIVARDLSRYAECLLETALALEEAAEDL